MSKASGQWSTQVFVNPNRGDLCKGGVRAAVVDREKRTLRLLDEVKKLLLEGSVGERPG